MTPQGRARLRVLRKKARDGTITAVERRQLAVLKRIKAADAPKTEKSVPWTAGKTIRDKVKRKKQAKASRKESGTRERGTEAARKRASAAAAKRKREAASTKTDPKTSQMGSVKRAKKVPNRPTPDNYPKSKPPKVTPKTKPKIDRAEENKATFFLNKKRREDWIAKKAQDARRTDKPKARTYRKPVTGGGGRRSVADQK